MVIPPLHCCGHAGNLLAALGQTGAASGETRESVDTARIFTFCCIQLCSRTCTHVVSSRGAISDSVSARYFPLVHIVIEYLPKLNVVVDGDDGNNYNEAAGVRPPTSGPAAGLLKGEFDEVEVRKTNKQPA
jgi:hypothetical protein